jgi:flagellar basal-body rod protein FlgC
MSFASIYDVAGSAMNAQTIRLNTISSNIANADSVSGNPDDVFKPLKPIFMNQPEIIEKGGQQIPVAKVLIADVVQIDSLMDKRYEPSNPFANEEGFVYLSGIDTVYEMADMMSASRSFQMNVEVLGTAKSMQQSLIKILEA